MRNSKVTFRSLLGAFMPVRAVIIAGVIYFLVVWRFDLVRSWIYFGMVFTGTLLGAVVMLVFAPGLSHERSSAKKGTKTWDLYLIFSYFVLGLGIMPLLAGLDARFGWSLLPDWFIYIGVTLYVLMFALTQWAMLVNPFFEGTVRIQEDRGHKVVVSGPYRLVRHPGYVGMFWGVLVLPFVLGSLYALIPSFLMMVIMIIRTALEDKMLLRELEGYKDYATTVRYRLFPGIW